MPKVKLDKDLYTRVKEHVDKEGYSSIEEFVAHALEKEIKKSGSDDVSEEEEIKKRLQGLGYIS